MTAIDLNSDLGDGFGPWYMGDDATMLSIVTSANVACGGHTSDPETMFRTLELAKQRGVCIGAHPGFMDRAGFGRRVIPMSPAEIGRMCAAQIGALMGAASLVDVTVAYVKPHGALGNLAAHSICVHGDSTVAIDMAGLIRERLSAHGVKGGVRFEGESEPQLLNAMHDAFTSSAITQRN